MSADRESEVDFVGVEVYVFGLGALWSLATSAWPIEMDVGAAPFFADAESEAVAVHYLRKSLMPGVGVEAFAARPPFGGGRNV